MTDFAPGLRVMSDAETARWMLRRKRKVAACEKAGHPGLTWQTVARMSGIAARVVGAVDSQPDDGMVRVRCRDCGGHVPVASITALGARERSMNLRRNAAAIRHGSEPAHLSRLASLWDRYAERVERKW